MIRWLAVLLVVAVFVFEFMAWRRTLAPATKAVPSQVQGLPDSVVTRAPEDPGTLEAPDFPSVWLVLAFGVATVTVVLLLLALGAI